MDRCLTGTPGVAMLENMDPKTPIAVAETPTDADSTECQQDEGQLEGESPETGGEDSQPEDAESQAAGVEGVEGEEQMAAEEPPAPEKVGCGDELTDEELEQSIAALIFASPDPLSIGRLKSLLQDPPAARVRAAIGALGQRLAASGLPLHLRSLAGGLEILTVREQGDVVARLVKQRKTERISPAGLETLSIIAYRQPATKAEIEAIRGVQAGPILRSLVDRGLVRVTGRAEQPGSPLQYGTTKDFLDRFGLDGLGDLPRDAELAKD